MQPGVIEEASETPPVGTWWSVVGDRVELTRMPEPGEALPEVAVKDYRLRMVLQGDDILPVIGPNGERLTYGRRMGD